MKELKITLKAADFNTIDAGTQKELYLNVNNRWAKKLCRRKEEGRCESKDCMTCIPLNGFSYSLFDTLTLTKGKTSAQYSIKSIGRGKGDTSLGAKEGETYFIVKFEKKD